MHGRLDRIEMQVEEVAKGKKKRHSKKKSKTSSSPSSSSSTPDRKKAKKHKKEKKSKCAGRLSKSEEVSGTLDEADKRELQEFRRQAEMTKLRAEVRAAMEAERGESDSVPAASTPKVSRTTRVTAPETLTPKTCRVLAAESRVYQDGETKQLITGASTWEQLSALPVAEVKALLRQFCPHEQLPRSRADIVRDVVSEETPFQPQSWKGVGLFLMGGLMVWFFLVARYENVVSTGFNGGFLPGFTGPKNTAKLCTFWGGKKETCHIFLNSDRCTYLVRFLQYRFDDFLMAFVLWKEICPDKTFR